MWCRLEDYVFSVTDGDHQAPPKVSKGIPFLVISNIADGSLDFSNTRYVPEEYYEKIQMERKPKRGDILFSVTGSYGIVVNIKTDRQFCFQRHIGLIKPTISNEYLSFVLMSNYIKSLCDKLATGTAQKTVGLDTLRSLYVPIAPIEEQERIVAKIKHLLLQISFLEAGKGKLVAAIKQAKSKILDLAIHGKLVPQDPNDEPAIELLKRIYPKAEIITDNGHYQKLPVGWCLTKVKDAFIINPKNKENDDIEAGYVPMANISDGFSNHFSFETKKWETIKSGFTHFSDGDIAVAKISPCLENRKSMVLSNLPNGIGAGTTELHVFRPLCVTQLYGLYFFKSNYFINKCIGTFNGVVGQQRVGKNIVECIDFPLPPLAEQQRIVAKIEEIFQQLDMIETAL